MKIAVIAGRGHLHQWPADKLSPRWEVVVAGEVNELERHRDVEMIIDLCFSPDEEHVRELARWLPKPVMINSMVHTIGEIGLPFIRINGWPGMLEREVHELAIGPETEADFLDGLYGQLEWKYRLVPDIPGMISGRILAAIINEAYYTLQEKVSTREEIDVAMKLGTNYPFGPFEWSEKIGLENIYDLLNKLGATDHRYMPAKSLVDAL
jgi:3-hydroxybutyryl-CoA dehydrogenase